MAAHVMAGASLVDRIKTTLVGLRMPRALEIVDVIVSRRGGLQRVGLGLLWAGAG